MPCQVPSDRAPVIHRNDKLRLRQRRLDVSRHVVRALVLMPVPSAFRHQPVKERFEIGADIGIGIFLHQKRRGGVPAPDGQQAHGDRLRRHPATHLLGDPDEPLAVGRNRQPMHCLEHDYAATPLTWRNGHRGRVLDTRLGSLQLRIPSCGREATSRHSWKRGRSRRRH